MSDNKEMPRLDAGLQGELMKGANLKPTESNEKNILPSAEDLKQEKTHQNILTGIEGFKADGLKPTETKEKTVLPNPSDIQAEKTHQGLIQGVESFSSEKLKNVKTREPQSPTAQYGVEKARDSSLAAVTGFDKTNLKKSETMEKNSLPPAEAIAQEMEHIKFKSGIEDFDRTKLSHAETVEKNSLPTKEIIAEEKSLN